MKSNLVFFCLGLIISSAFSFVPRRVKDYSSPESIEREFSNFSFLVMREPVVANRAPTANDKLPIGSLWLNTSNNNLYIRFSTVDTGWRTWTTSAL